MRKKLLRIFGLTALFAVALTGCATVANIQNDNSELIFNGGSVALVGDYLYCANGYTPLSGATTDYAYKANAKLSYLNRVALQSGFKTKAEKPKKTEKVNSKVLGFENSYIFVLGNYVYFASPNEHETLHPIVHAYNLVTLWRSKLNGDGLKELYTTDQYGSNAEMRVLKGSDDAYYWIVFDGSSIVSIKLGDKLGKAQVLATEVATVAMPGENDEYAVRNIIYTKSENNTNLTYTLDFASGESSRLTDLDASDIALVDRIGDTVFYTAGGSTYRQTIAIDEQGVVHSTSAKTELYASASVENISVVYNGYTFAAGSESKAIYYKSNDLDDAFELLGSSDYSQIMYVNGDWIYYASGNDIKRVSVRGVRSHADVQPETVVTMSSAISGKASVADNYLYYYAGLEPLNEDDDKTYEETSNVYLYRVRLGSNEDFQILSNFTRTEIEE